MAYGIRRFNATFNKGSPIIPILSRINLIPLIDTHFFKIHSNIALPSTPSFPKGLFTVSLHVGVERIPKKCYTQKWRGNDQEEEPEPDG